MKLAIWGINGKMGQILLDETKKYNDIQVVFGVDNLKKDYGNISVYTDFSEINEKVDVIIDFSNHSAVHDILKYALKMKTPVIFCSTGHNEKEIQEIKNASKKIPIILSANMSFGGNFLIDFAEKNSKIFVNNGFTVDIAETHHKAKLDRPSGTALSVLNTILSKCPELSLENNFMGKRQENQICVHSYRLGNETGIHELIFSNDYEIVTLSHRVFSRNAFAKGAIDVAYKIINKKHGFYSMKNIEENIKN